VSNWLAALPPGWSEVNPRRHFRERREPSKPSDLHLTPSQHLGVLSQADYMARTGSKVVLNLSTPDSMKHVEPGDFIAHLRSFQGGLERSDLTGKVSSAYTVIEPLASVESTYFRWVLKSRPFIEELSSGLEQLRDGQSIKFGDFTANSLPMPPREEQRRIADFLDDRVARIDQIIAAQRKQIDNLLEWIASAVNGLLTPQQGVGQWLRVKDVSSKVGSGKTPRGGADAYLDEGVAFLRSQNVHNDGLRLDDVAFISTEIDEEMSSTRVREGDVLLNITGGSLGRCCVADGRALPANVSQHVCIIRPTAINPSHLALLIRSKVVQDQIRLAQVGGNREGLNFEQARELRFWHPEDATVWSRCRYWEKQGTEGVAMIGHAVSLLQSYKQALITAAVTGELDVTTAGSGIPG
jgi:type I restriction enzyme S subunit